MSSSSPIGGITVVGSSGRGGRGQRRVAVVDARLGQRGGDGRPVDPRVVVLVEVREVVVLAEVGEVAVGRPSRHSRADHHDTGSLEGLDHLFLEPVGRDRDRDGGEHVDRRDGDLRGRPALVALAEVLGHASHHAGVESRLAGDLLAEHVVGRRALAPHDAGPHDGAVAGGHLAQDLLDRTRRLLQHGGDLGRGEVVAVGQVEHLAHLLAEQLGGLPQQRGDRRVGRERRGRRCHGSGDPRRTDRPAGWCRRGWSPTRRPPGGRRAWP